MVPSAPTIKTELLLLSDTGTFTKFLAAAQGNQVMRHGIEPCVNRFIVHGKQKNVMEVVIEQRFKVIP
jgi:hypothetical protein